MIASLAIACQMMTRRFHYYAISAIFSLMPLRHSYWRLLPPFSMADYAAITPDAAIFHFADDAEAPPHYAATFAADSAEPSLPLMPLMPPFAAIR